MLKSNISKLLKHGSPFDLKNKLGETCLHSGVRSGSYNSVLILLNNGASPNIIDNNNNGETPLHIAVKTPKKNFKIVELLVENGADIHSFDTKNILLIDSLMNQEKSIVKMYPSCKNVHIITLKKNNPEGYYKKNDYQGGVKIIFIKPNAKQLAYWIKNKVLTNLKYKVRILKGKLNG